MIIFLVRALHNRDRKWLSVDLTKKWNSQFWNKDLGHDLTNCWFFQSLAGMVAVATLPRVGSGKGLP